MGRSLQRKGTLILFPLIIAAALIFCMAACGRRLDDSSESYSEEVQAEDFVYVAEFTELEELRDINIHTAKFAGDSLYYTGLEFGGEEDAAKRFVGEYSLAESRVVRKLPFGDWNGEVKDFWVAYDGSVYVLYYDYTSGVSLLAFDGQGNMSWQLNLREEWGVTSVDQQIAVDREKQIYVFLTDRMMCLDADGVLQWEMRLDGVDDHVENAGFGSDGKLYISYFQRSNEYVLTEIDLEERRMGSVYKNYSWERGMDITTGAGYDFLLSEADGLCGYDCGTQSVSEIFSWTDYGLNGSLTGAFEYREDGEVRVLFGGSAGKTELAVLTKCDLAEVPAKQEIVIATFQTWPDIQAAVAAFNRQSDSCHATIREYTFDFGHISDAVEKLNIDIISKDRCPDIIFLDESLNVKALAANGVFEDLSPWLEQSGVLAAEDYPQNVLEGYTFDGVLTGIPYSFRLDTIVGRSADVGAEPGWTTDEMIAFAGAHPGAKLFHDANNWTVLDVCLRFGKSDFIDWTAGRADFDSPEFKKQLSFAAGFPEPDYGSTEFSPRQIKSGEVLLYEADINEVWDIQIYNALYEGDAVFIGYPTADGSNGCRLTSTNAYGIVSASKHKEEAWKFLEYFLSGDPEDWSAGGLLSNNRARMAAATEMSYVRNNFGELLLDADGRPVREHEGELSYSGMKVEYHKVTEEEIALLESLVESARIVSTSDDRVSFIINEEAAPVFQGQISADAAAAMIQNRVQLYLDESN